MNRNSLLYKIRRELQVILYDVLPKDILSKLYYRFYLGEKLNLKQPKTFNEKIQWYKLNYCPTSEKIINCTDKYKVREFIKSKNLDHLLVPLINKWNNANDINWDVLPKQFVLKANHGCAYNIVCNDKSTIDTKSTEKKLNKWLNEDFGKFNVELHYGKIKPRQIICEEFLGENLTDYKFFCFNGEPKFFYVSNDMINDSNASMGYFKMNGEKIPVYRPHYKDIEKIELPLYFKEMLADTRKLAEDFPFVRVDFFVLENRYYFSELTFTPAGGLMKFNTDTYDVLWGNYLNLSEYF